MNQHETIGCGKSDVHTAHFTGFDTVPGYAQFAEINCGGTQPPTEVALSRGSGTVSVRVDGEMGVREVQIGLHPVDQWKRLGPQVLSIYARTAIQASTDRVAYSSADEISRDVTFS